MEFLPHLIGIDHRPVAGAIPEGVLRHPGKAALLIEFPGGQRVGKQTHGARPVRRRPVSEGRDQGRPQAFPVGRFGREGNQLQITGTEHVLPPLPHLLVKGSKLPLEGR